MNDTINQCPLCGNKPEIESQAIGPISDHLSGRKFMQLERWDHRIRCSKIECPKHTSGAFLKTKKEAIEIWNEGEI